MLKRTDPGTEPPHDERPIGELVQQLVEDGKAYARAEIGVVQAILTAKGKALILPSGLFALAFMLVLAAILELALGVFFKLNQAMGPILAGFLAFVLFAAVAGGLAWYAVRRVRQIL
jgi:hypothetical protein